MRRNRLPDRSGCSNSAAYAGNAGRNNHAASTTQKGGSAWPRPPRNSDIFYRRAFSYNLTRPETLVRFAVVELLSNWQALAPVVNSGGKW